MLNLKQATTLRNALIHREIASKKIADFPKSTPESKHVDHAVILSFLNGFAESALTDPETCPVTVDTPTVASGYVDRVLDEHRLIPPYKIIPAWGDAAISIRLACMHVLLTIETGGFSAPFTLRFSEDVISAAFACSRGPRYYLHDRVQRHLNGLAPSLFWQAFELSEKGVVHSHGSFYVPGRFSEGDIKRALRSAGGEVKFRAEPRQVDFAEPIPHKRAFWATYARKDPDAVDQYFRGSAYSSSQKLRGAAQDFYESVRSELNQRRRILAA